MDDIRQELAALRTLVERQQAEIAELKAEAAKPARPAGETSTTRRQMLMGAAAAALGGAAASSVSQAEAANGDAMLVGSYNNIASRPTALSYRGSVGLTDYGFGMVDQTLDAFPRSASIAGHTSGNFQTAVLGYEASGLASPDYIGVYGMTTSATAVAGAASAIGTGVSAYSRAGVGLQARGKTAIQADGDRLGVDAFVSGDDPSVVAMLAYALKNDETKPAYPTALVVHGVLRASRAGRAIVPAGARSVRVALKPLTTTSLVLATPQKVSGTLAVAGVTVRTAAPTSFLITLTGAAPTGGLSVAWVVVDMLALS